MPPKPQHSITTQDHNTSIMLDYSLCLGCGQCARVCSDSQMIGALKPAAPKMPPTPVPRNGDMSGNTDTTRALLDTTDCIGCGSCI